MCEMYLLSVPPSVRLSHSGVVAKQLDGSSRLVTMVTTLCQHDICCPSVSVCRSDEGHGVTVSDGGGVTQGVTE